MKSVLPSDHSTQLQIDGLFRETAAGVEGAGGAVAGVDLQLEAVQLQLVPQRAGMIQQRLSNALAAQGLIHSQRVHKEHAAGNLRAAADRTKLEMEDTDNLSIANRRKESVFAHGAVEFLARQCDLIGLVDIRAQADMQRLYLLHDPFGGGIIGFRSGADADLLPGGKRRQFLFQQKIGLRIAAQLKDVLREALKAVAAVKALRGQVVFLDAQPEHAAAPFARGFLRQAHQLRADAAAFCPGEHIDALNLRSVF